jgi:hypothetical protein
MRMPAIHVGLTTAWPRLGGGPIPPQPPTISSNVNVIPPLLHVHICGRLGGVSRRESLASGTLCANVHTITVQTTHALCAWLDLCIVWFSMARVSTGLEFKSRSSGFP